MIGPSRIRGLALGVLAVALGGAAFFEFAALRGWLAADWPGSRLLTQSLYGFQLLVIAVAIVPLVMVFLATHRPLPLLVALGCASWLLGDLFYVSYAALLNRALMYPSVADLAFQGFHVGIVAGLGSQIVRPTERSFWPAMVLGIGLCALPSLVRITHPYPLDDLAYATFFMALAAATMMIAVGLTLRRKLYVLAIGLLLVVVADAVFAAASLSGAGFLYALDPVWFVGFALTAFAVVRAVQDEVMA